MSRAAASSEGDSGLHTAGQTDHMQKGGNIVLSELQNSIYGVALPVTTTASALDDILALLASCLLFLLYEKLSSGDQVAATPHL